MAVVRMTGEIDGTSIIFSKDKSGTWVAPVPLNLDGEFIVEVTAYDEAGNMAYSTAMLFAIDPSTLSAQVIPLNYVYKVGDDPFACTVISSDFAFYVVDPHMQHAELPQNFSVRVVL
ncbi:Ig-like domain repeat protein [Domibacillus indicus]|uniref:PF13754 domain-containing protein n=1 Tax=Domibacillus indicus TaxID=1437523 RepID=UPI00203F16E0|nr:PF13754 domain-containing protein [Domibacillus indicus]MCM3789412.1 Ig-like domain repeat protein [Domibacillus indicus]